MTVRTWINPQSVRILAMLQLILLLFTSCTKDEEAVSGRLHSNEDPYMSANDVEVLFSDSGKVQARLTAPLLNEYVGKNPRMDFPRGFKIIMYDSVMRVKSSITAMYGIRFDYKGYMEGRGNVIVRNEQKNEQLNTEHLIWDERNHRIYNNDPIKVITPGKVLYGNDLESDEAFTRYSFKNPTGQMMLKKDSV
ncbi:MAG: LPS export ABC transporter periplasmic protein LptC [Bacteroidetes bacterium]|nr:LPS export ABC transporter periplasmic protein LptC [Bacteroidota bacterium]